MRKARWKKIVAASAIIMSLGMAFPAANIQAEEVDFGSEIIDVVEGDSTISPYADVITIYYRVYKGRRQKRRWNRTQGKWVDKDWIDLGPA